MASEQFSLCWDNFHRNMSMGMQSLLETEDLVDVTLAVEGKCLKAHKMVLSVCSPYFRELFQSNPCKHPIVFMKDVSYIALTDLLQFMYQGEVQVAQENLSAFIKTAEALQIKGLTGDNGGQNDIEIEDIEKPFVESTKRTHEAEAKQTPVNRVKKLAGPASKRPKLSPITSTPSRQPSVSFLSTGSKFEVTSVSTNDNGQTNDSANLKIEPENVEQLESETINESQIEQYTDDTNVDDIGDDTEEFSLVESGTDEPKASTSTDVGGENQDYFFADPDLSIKKPRSRTRTRFIHDGFVYHSKLIAGKNNRIRYLACAEIKRSGCRARAILPVGMSSNYLRITHPHNHPPNENVEEKECFVAHLKQAVRGIPGSLRRVYDTISILYPKGAEELPFKSICSSLHRWRRDISL